VTVRIPIDTGLTGAYVAPPRTQVSISHDEGSLQGSSLQGLPAGKLEGSWRELGFAPVGSDRSAHRSVRGGGAVARALGMPPLAAFAPAKNIL
jgi:hypothetical protein